MSGVALPSASAGSAAVGRPDDPPAVAPWIASASASLSTRDDARSDDRAILLGASPDVDADEASFLDSYFAFTSAHFGIDRAEVRARLDAYVSPTGVPFDVYRLYRACCERGGFGDLEEATARFDAREIFREMRNWSPPARTKTKTKTDPSDPSDEKGKEKRARASASAYPPGFEPTTAIFEAYAELILPYENAHQEDVCVEPCHLCDEESGKMIQCDACHRWTHEACNRAGAVVPLEPGSFKPGDVWIVSERESGGAGADEASGRGVDEAGSERRAKTTRSRIRDASAVTAEERRANVVLTAGAEDVFACDACHYRDACRPGHEPRVTSRFVVSENARSDDELAALALAPGAIPPSGALMDAETFCRLLCLRRGFTPLVSGIRCPTIQPSVDVSDAAYWAEEEAWEEEAAWEEEEEEGPGRRSTGANAAAPVGIAGPSPGASASAKPPPAPTPMSEKDRNEKRRGTEDVFCAASDAALAAERRRRGRFRSMLPAGIEEEDEQLRLAMDQSAAAYAEAADRERRRREREELAEAETTAYAAREDADAA